jgi:hypothetical protein
MANGRNIGRRTWDTRAAARAGDFLEWCTSQIEQIDVILVYHGTAPSQGRKVRETREIR